MKNKLEADIMAEENKFTDEMLTDEQLDKVAGGLMGQAPACRRQPLP